MAQVAADKHRVTPCRVVRMRYCQARMSGEPSSSAARSHFSLCFSESGADTTRRQRRRAHGVSCLARVQRKPNPTFPLDYRDPERIS